LIADLERFDHYGFMRSRYKTETYLINGYIILSSPRPGFPYNHHKLTDEGRTALVLAKARRQSALQMAF
jgi:hypothetical protein